MQALVEKYYPEIWTHKVAKHYPRIPVTPFAELEAMAGYSMLEVNLVGRDHATGESADERYMSLQRLAVRWTLPPPLPVGSFFSSAACVRAYLG